MYYTEGGLPGRIDDVSADVTNQIQHLENNLVRGYDLLQLFKEEADHIRKEMDVMMNTLVEKTELVHDEVHGDLRNDYKSMKSAIKVQRDENDLLYKELQSLTKNTIASKRKVNYLQSKIEELE